VSDVKTFLFNNGWVPTEWNKKREGKDWIQTSPKITEDSIEFLGGDSKLYMNYKKTSSAYSTLKTWIAETDENGMLHGDARIVGTPSMRMRHSIIVNVKSTDTKWGKEMRALFKCLPGWKIVGCDSSGNQARGLAHYLKNPEYVDLLLNGDIHQHNADILTRVMHDLGFNITVPRSVAKRVLYATLFGASGSKIFGYIMGYVDDELGKALKEGFLGKIPGFHQLVEALEENWKKTKRRDRQGYIVGIAGNKIYVDSKHKLLVYLLQACEKATCAAAVMLTMEWLESEGIPYIPLIMMHDEEQFMVPEEFAERATQLGNAAFREAPKLFGINIMDGDGKYGDTWLDTH
jgi:hypothetical protein